MGIKLTDAAIPELIVPASGGDLIMLVDVDDVTSGAEGSTVKQQAANFLRGKVFGKNSTLQATPATALIFNMGNIPNHPGSQGLANDWVIFMDAIADRMIIGIATSTVAVFPGDLDDPTKFVKFYDGTKLLP